MANSLQRASMWKRISAWLFDVILLAILSVLLMWGISALIGFDAQYDRMNARYTAIAASFDLDLKQIQDTAYSELTEELRAKVEAANAALAADAEATKAYALVAQMTILMVSIALLLGHVLLEFVVPLLLGHGRTLGKKIFGVAVMHSNSVKIGHVSLFIRSILGKYTIETMVPVMVALMFMMGSVNLIALLLAGAVCVAQVILPLCTRKRSLIHDLLADTVAVDFASQKIFNTMADLIAFKEAAHADKVAHQGF